MKMSDNKFKPFFADFKKSLSVIEKSVNGVTTDYSNFSNGNSFSEASKNFDEKLNEVNHLKNEALTMKKELEGRRDYYDNYFRDFQDLVFELEDKVNIQEKYLQKFGYEPLKIEPTAGKEELHYTPPEKDTKKKDKTPTIYDFMDANQLDNFKRSINSTEEKSNSLEASDETPKLIFDPVIRKSSHSSELIPSPTPKDDTQNTEELIKNLMDCDKLARRLDFN